MPDTPDQTSKTCRPQRSARWPRPKRVAQPQKDLIFPKELGGRDGPEPVRYGDWEKKGIAIDF